MIALHQALYDDSLEVTGKIQLLGLLHEYDALLLDNSTRLEHVLATLLAMLVRGSATNYIFKGEVLITTTAIMVQHEFLTTQPKSLARFIDTLLRLVQSTNGSDPLYRRTACQCLHELELSFPGLLARKLGHLVKLTTDETSFASEAYAVLLATALRNAVVAVVKRDEGGRGGGGERGGGESGVGDGGSAGAGLASAAAGAVDGDAGGEVGRTAAGTAEAIDTAAVAVTGDGTSNSAAADDDGAGPATATEGDEAGKPMLLEDLVRTDVEHLLPYLQSAIATTKVKCAFGGLVPNSSTTTSNSNCSSNTATNNSRTTNATNATATTTTNSNAATPSTPDPTTSSRSRTTSESEGGVGDDDGDADVENISRPISFLMDNVSLLNPPAMVAVIGALVECASAAGVRPQVFTRAFLAMLSSRDMVCIHALVILNMWYQDELGSNDLDRGAVAPKLMFQLNSSGLDRTDCAMVLAWLQGSPELLPSGSEPRIRDARGCLLPRVFDAPEVMARKIEVLAAVLRGVNGPSRRGDGGGGGGQGSGDGLPLYDVTSFLLSTLICFADHPSFEATARPVRAMFQALYVVFWHTVGSRRKRLLFSLWLCTMCKPVA
jgi:uncharacterized membrane protein YgcG